MRVRPSDSRKVIWADVRREEGGGGVVGGKVRKTKVEGWRVGVRVARRWGREVEPGDGVVEVILWCCFGLWGRFVVIEGMLWAQDMGKGSGKR